MRIVYVSWRRHILSTEKKLRQRKRAMVLAVAAIERMLVSQQVMGTVLL